MTQKTTKRAKRTPKWQPGKQYRCTFAATQFYTVGDLYTCTQMGNRVGFMGNDGIFDSVTEMLSTMELVDG